MADLDARYVEPAQGFEVIGSTGNMSDEVRLRQRAKQRAGGGEIALES